MKGSNAFAVDLYAQLSKQPGNLFFSPESISTAFGNWPTPARAGDQTATEMEHVFHTSRCRSEKLHPAMGALLAEMNGQHKGYELRVADALWAQQDESFEANYLKLVQSDYAAGFHRVKLQAFARTACAQQSTHGLGTADQRQDQRRPDRPRRT